MHWWQKYLSERLHPACTDMKGAPADKTKSVNMTPKTRLVSPVKLIQWFLPSHFCEVPQIKRPFLTSYIVFQSDCATLDQLTLNQVKICGESCDPEHMIHQPQGGKDVSTGSLFDSSLICVFKIKLPLWFMFFFNICPFVCSQITEDDLLCYCYSRSRPAQRPACPCRCTSASQRHVKPRPVRLWSGGSPAPACRCRDPRRCRDEGERNGWLGMSGGDVLKSGAFTPVKSPNLPVRCKQLKVRLAKSSHITHIRTHWGRVTHTIQKKQSRGKFQLTAWKLPWYFPGSHLRLQSKTTLESSPSLDYLIVWTCSSS